jgi:hypothetical protein
MRLLTKAATTANTTTTTTRSSGPSFVRVQVI